MARAALSTGPRLARHSGVEASSYDWTPGPEHEPIPRPVGLDEQRRAALSYVLVRTERRRTRSRSSSPSLYLHLNNPFHRAVGLSSRGRMVCFRGPVLSRSHPLDNRLGRDPALAAILVDKWPLAWVWLRHHLAGMSQHDGMGALETEAGCRGDINGHRRPAPLPRLVRCHYSPQWSLPCPEHHDRSPRRDSHWSSVGSDLDPTAACRIGAPASLSGLVAHLGRGRLPPRWPVDVLQQRQPPLPPFLPSLQPTSPEPVNRVFFRPTR